MPPKKASTKKAKIEEGMFDKPNMDARFEKSTKFWQCKQQGSNWGVIYAGLDAKTHQTLLHKCDSEDEAKAACLKKIAEKVKEGYKLKQDVGTTKVGELPEAKGKKKAAAAAAAGGEEEGEAEAEGEEEVTEVEKEKTTKAKGSPKGSPKKRGGEKAESAAKKSKKESEEVKKGADEEAAAGETKKAEKMVEA